MARPRVHHEERVTTAIRLPVALRDELHDAARSRDVSANYLVNRALIDFLDRLPDVDSLGSTSDGSANYVEQS